MTPELTYLLYSVILLIAHVLIQATFSDLSKGIAWAIGPQDEARDQNLIAARIQRALRNYLETYPAFIALVLIVTVSEASTSQTVLGATIYFWARVVYVPAYASGIPMARSIPFFASLIGIAMMIVSLLS